MKRIDFRIFKVSLFMFMIISKEGVIDERPENDVLKMEISPDSKSMNIWNIAVDIGTEFYLIRAPCETSMVFNKDVNSY